jgi:hypothetical protein
MRRIESKAMQRAAAGILLVSVGAVAFGLVYSVRGQARADIEETWIREAELVIVEFVRERGNLHPYPAVPGGVPPDLGQFVDLGSSGHHGATSNIEGYEYLVAERMAQFTDGNLPVTIYVEEGAKLAPSSKNVFVRINQWSTGEREGEFGQRLFLHVVHPDLH